jgi:hypothetical protein
VRESKDNDSDSTDLKALRESAGRIEDAATLLNRGVFFLLSSRNALSWDGLGRRRWAKPPRG